MQEVLKSTIYYPMLVSNKGTAEPLAKEEDTLIWKKYLTLSPEKRAIISSYELPRKIKELQGKFYVNEVVIGQISLCIRKVFFGEMDVAGFEAVLNSLFADSADKSVALKIIEFFNAEIVHLVPKIPLDPEESISGRSGVESIVKKLSILKAIAEYPRLNDQLITNEKIKVKGQSEPQRPSLANWIRYYRDELGVGFHDQVLRGRFLFQSENGKRLSNEERERINLVLKSIEEDFPLDIDIEQGGIVFPSRPRNTAPVAGTPAKPLFSAEATGASVRPVKPYIPAPASVPTPAVKTGAPTAPASSKPPFFSSRLSPAKNVAGETLHFSTGHVLPGEKTPAQSSGMPAAPAPASTPPTTPVPPTPATSGFRPAGINQNRGATLPRSPYSIRPLRLRDDVGAKEE